MNQTTAHIDTTAPYTPIRPRIARIAAIVLLAVLAALTVQSFFAGRNTPTLGHLAPQIVRPAPTLCSEYPKAHFVFISYRGTPATITPTCDTLRPVLMSA